MNIQKLHVLTCNSSQMSLFPASGSEKVFFWKRGLFKKVLFLENLEILETLENPKTLENKGKPNHLLEILENSEILESEKTPFVMPPFSCPDCRGRCKRPGEVE